jgi:hypothetical protein
MGRFVVDARLPPAWDTRTRRRLVLTLYYLAIVVGLALVHLTPDSQATRFVYQAF